MLTRVRALLLRSAGRLDAVARTRRGQVAFGLLFWVALFTVGAQFFRSAWDGNDFEAYFEGGRAVLSGRDVIPFVAKAGGRRYIYPPTLAVLVSPLSLLPFKVAATVWVCLIFGALAYSVSACLRLLRVKTGPERWFIALLALACVARPLDSEFGNGQVNLIVLAVVLRGATDYVRGRRVLCGVWFALAACIKVTPALLLVYLLLKREWRALGAALAGVVLFLAVIPGVAMQDARAGIRNTKQWRRRVVRRALAGKRAPPAAGTKEAGRTAEQNAFVAGESVRALVFRAVSHTPVNFGRRFAPTYVNVVDIGRGNAQLVYYALAGLVLLVTAAVTGLRSARDDPLRFSLEMAVWLAAILLISPVSRKAMFVSLLLPYACIAALVARRPSPRALIWIVACLVAFVICSSSVSGKVWSTILRSSGLYACTALIPWVVLVRLAWRGGRIPEGTELEPDAKAA